MQPSRIFSTNCYLFLPPHPIKKFYYRCDRKFHLDDLIKLYEEHDNYAIVLISGKRSEFYLHNANSTKFLKGLDESLPNQHKTGGQSAPRFGRIRDEKIGWYAKKIAEIMSQFYVKNGKIVCKGLVIAGPAEMKDLVCEHELFAKYFAKYLLKVVTISEITDQSIYQVIQLAADVLGSESSDKELVNDFEAKLADPSWIDLIIFGSKEVLTAFEKGELKEIYVGEKSVHKEFILKSAVKTKIHIVKSIEFSGKFGELIGIKYYANYQNDEIIEV